MIGLYVASTVSADQVDTFLRWKALEGSIQRRTAGFLKRTIHRSVERPDTFFYVAYWESKEHMNALGIDPEFLAAKKTVGVGPGSFPGEMMFVSEVFDEVSDLPDYRADGRPMLGIHVEFVEQPGKEDGLLAWKALEGTGQRRTPGFLKRSLHRNVAQPNVFYYISYWETQEQMEAFGSSDWFKTAGASISRKAGDFTATLDHVTEVFNDVGGQSA